MLRLIYALRLHLTLIVRILSAVTVAHGTEANDPPLTILREMFRVSPRDHRKSLGMSDLRTQRTHWSLSNSEKKASGMVFAKKRRFFEVFSANTLGVVVFYSMLILAHPKKFTLQIGDSSCRHDSF
jgi:hypothetical protein